MLLASAKSQEQVGRLTREYIEPLVPVFQLIALQADTNSETITSAPIPTLFLENVSLACQINPVATNPCLNNLFATLVELCQNSADLAML